MSDRKFTFEFVGDYSMDRLLKRAVTMARPHSSGKSPRWVAVRDTFGWGSTTSAQLCLHYGVDPDEMIDGLIPEREPEEDEVDASTLAPAEPMDKEAARRVRRGYKPLGKYLEDRREVREQLADVLETLPEPLTCKALVEAFVALYPERAKWCESGVSNALFVWTQAGWLLRDGTRKPSAYHRTKAWRTNGAASDVTRRYNDFRSKIPGQKEAGDE